MLIESIFQIDNNVLLAAIISLLLVILFVLLLHVYAKWFLVYARRTNRNSVSLQTPPRLRRLNTYRFNTTIFGSPCKGLDPSVIASIPLFVYEHDETKAELDCVICLSVFEEREVGRRLPKCRHMFHVECIDMWLKSHQNCPICRTLVEGCLGHDDMASGRLSLVSSGWAGEVEVVVEVPRYGENENESRVGEAVDSSLSSSSLSSQVVAIGDSLKRMMSRSRSEHKVHPSASEAQPVIN